MLTNKKFLKKVSLRLYTINITYANAASCREVFCIGVITRIGKRHDENTNAVFDPCGMAHVVGVRIGRFLTSKKCFYWVDQNCQKVL